MPKDLWIAKIERPNIKDRIAGIVCPRATTVGAEGQSLVFHSLSLLVGVAMSCVNGNHDRLTVAFKAGRIGVIHDRGAGVDPDLPLLRERNRQMPPVDEVVADRVTPTHVPHLSRRDCIDRRDGIPHRNRSSRLGSFIQFRGGVKWNWGERVLDTWDRPWVGVGSKLVSHPIGRLLNAFGNHIPSRITMLVLNQTTAILSRDNGNGQRHAHFRHPSRR
jgi:hypothetical protein